MCFWTMESEQTCGTPSLRSVSAVFFPIAYVRLSEFGSTLQCEIMSQSSRACLLALFGIL